jgi:urease subunit gamma/beta
MHLAPRDLDKLILAQAGLLAQRRLARGLRLNHAEAVALLSTVLMELIRDGQRVAALMDVGRRILGRAQVLAGVPEMIDEVQIEGTFGDGTKLVTVHQPIVLVQGDLTLALHGSFLPQPDPGVFPDPADEERALVPGQIWVQPGEIEVNAGRETVTLPVRNTGDRPIQVGSHYPFVDTNRALAFDRALAKGRRLDIPAGTAVRFEPGEEKTVRLVDYGFTHEATA